MQIERVLTLDSNKFYEFDFRYVVNLDTCESNEIQFQVFLLDTDIDVSYSALLYEYDPIIEIVKNNKWSRFPVCFEIESGEFKLSIVMNSRCSSPDGKPFISVDEIKLNEKIEIPTENECKNFKITEILTTEMVEEVTPTIDCIKIIFNNKLNNFFYI